VLRHLRVCKRQNYSLHLPSEGVAEVSGWACEEGCFHATEKLGWEATLQAECQPSMWLEQRMPIWQLRRSYMCPATCYFWLLPTRSNSQLTTWQTSNGCVTSTIIPVNM
jgi:hypothetical protein